MCDDTLKSEMDNMEVNTIIFCTNKTLNERFTPKQPRCVFIINNGYTRSFKNNKLKARVIFDNDMDMTTHSRFSSYLEGNIEETGKEFKGNEMMSKLEQVSSQSLNRRRVVLMPSKISKLKTLKRQNQRFRHPRYGLRRQFGRRIYLNPYKRTERVIFTPVSYRRNRSYNRSLYKWKRPLPTKEELDNELDSYMANLKSQTSTGEDDVDPFVREYMIEVEKYLNGDDDDDAQIGPIFE